MCLQYTRTSLHTNVCVAGGLKRSRAVPSQATVDGYKVSSSRWMSLPNWLSRDVSVHFFLRFYHSMWQRAVSSMFRAHFTFHALHKRTRCAILPFSTRERERWPSLASATGFSLSSISKRTILCALFHNLCTYTLSTVRKQKFAFAHVYRSCEATASICCYKEPLAHRRNEHEATHRVALDGFLLTPVHTPEPGTGTRRASTTTNRVQKSEREKGHKRKRNFVQKGKVKKNRKIQNAERGNGSRGNFWHGTSPTCSKTTINCFSCIHSCTPIWLVSSFISFFLLVFVFLLFLLRTLLCVQTCKAIKKKSRAHTKK